MSRPFFSNPKMTLPEFRIHLETIQKGTHPTQIRIVNEKGIEINTKNIEYVEQAMVEAYIEPSDVVLELGARYGSVSCRINLKLLDKTKQVSVEPDARVWDALEKNRDANNCQFHIVKGCISHAPRAMIYEQAAGGYGASTKECSQSSIPHFLLQEIKQTYAIDQFTALFADCEGCLGYFLHENPDFLDSLRLFIFEADNPSACNYRNVVDMLIEKGFEQVKGGVHTVWRRI